MSYIRFILWGLLALLVGLSGCTANAPPRFASANVVASLSGPADEAFARAYAPIPLRFPQDHGAHPTYRTEWWYYTGNLTDDAGQAYGYQLTFFRSALTPTQPTRPSDLATNQIYMAHFALTNVAAQQHASFERFSRGAGGLAGATGEPYAIWLEDWEVQMVEPGVTRLRASATDATGPVALDLTLRETRPPILHGDQGLSQKGPEAGNASYYYSLVQIESSGTVTSQGTTVAVRGVSWMDHEFGTSALSANAAGWDWFSIQLESGAVLMLAQVRTATGGVVPQFEGTYVSATGAQQIITANDLTITALDQWTSPHTGFTYPSGWQLEIPRIAASLTIAPALLDQEMQVSFVYWEGAVKITGTVDGEAVQGVGYVELTGYGQQAGQYQR
ncbi:MAG: carotenoid 1,2-hydratase [Caldilineaceae bacterium]|nr:carotenoid 1,2-hydratase [Caldilineaceae bacterium]